MTFNRQMATETPLLSPKTNMLQRDRSGGVSRKKNFGVGPSNDLPWNSLRVGQESLFLARSPRLHQNSIVNGIEQCPETLLTLYSFWLPVIVSFCYLQMICM